MSDLVETTRGDHIMTTDGFYMFRYNDFNSCRNDGPSVVDMDGKECYRTPEIDVTIYPDGEIFGAYFKKQKKKGKTVARWKKA